MKKISAAFATLQYLFGRRARACSDGIEITSFPGKKKMVPYAHVEWCQVRAVRETIAIRSEKSEARYQRIVLFADEPHAMKMSTESADAFLRHLKRYAPSIRVEPLPGKARSISVFQK